MPQLRTVAPLTRRGFIAGASALALGVAATSLRRPALARDTSDGAWRGLAGMLRGRLLRSGDPGFRVAALPFNLRYAEVLPSGIAICRDAEDVSAAILWARENDVALVARSGGHSYAGYSTTTGLMISLADLDDVSFDASTDIVAIGGGVRNEGVYSALEQA